MKMFETWVELHAWRDGAGRDCAVLKEAKRMNGKYGDQCACIGQCGIHGAWRCREVHGLDATWAKGQVALRQAGDVGLCCERCAKAIERKAKRKPVEETGSLFG